jgi:hypothetical protein
VHAAPKDALALVEAKSGAGSDPTALARAAALSWPPLPPTRPREKIDDKSEGVTVATKTPPLPPPRPAKLPRPSAANPFGALVVDAFNAPGPSDATAKALIELRRAAP